MTDELEDRLRAACREAFAGGRDADDILAALDDVQTRVQRLKEAEL